MVSFVFHIGRTPLFLHPHRIGRRRFDATRARRQIGSGEARHRRFLSRISRRCKKSPGDPGLQAHRCRRTHSTTSPPCFSPRQGRSWTPRPTGPPARSSPREEENEGSRPNRMETRFLEIAYRKFTKELAFPSRSDQRAIHLLESVRLDCTPGETRPGRLRRPRPASEIRATARPDRTRNRRRDASQKRNFISRIS